MTNNVENYNNLVHEGEVLAACRAMLPEVQTLLEYRAERMSVQVPGMITLMFRVTAKVRTNDMSTSEIKMICKRTPTLAKQLETLGVDMCERKLFFTGGPFVHFFSLNI
jgi:hypothetical protein